MRRLLPFFSVLALPTLAEAYTPEEFFTLKVKPIFSEKCFACHGEKEDKIKGELNLMSREGFLAGGESRKDILVPGHPEKSSLLPIIKWEDPDCEMPEKENDRLTPEQIADVEYWIKKGAVWPSEEEQIKIREADQLSEETEDGIIVKTSGGTKDEWTYRRYKKSDLWAYLPLQKITKPEGHPVDHFVKAKLEKIGAIPAPKADPRTLLRRLSFTLTGLPPKPNEMARWLKTVEGDFEAGFEKIIDELLASPHYGERWAQHWLDVVRYADTAGFSNDFELSNAWRYRDYVIRSLNADKPYNQFVMEQLAGDEMNPNDPEMKVATGFLRMGPWEHTAMLAKEVSRQQYLDDVVDNVGQVFLANPMSCCKCHDHKFDPIPTRDYYRLYAAFSTTQPTEMAAEFLPEENRSAFPKNREHVVRLRDFAVSERDRLYKKREDAAREWYAKRNLPYKNLKARNKDPDGSKPARFEGLTTEDEGQLKVREQDAWIWNRRLERFQALAQSVHNGGFYVRPSKHLRPPNLKNPRQKAKHEKLPDDHILSGGSVHSPTEKVTPGVLSVMGIPTESGTAEDPYALPTGAEGRRLQLAKWMTHEKNSLTQRVIVNRIWKYHFGSGLAKNPNNFGGTGKKPTHPKLLDYLTGNFVKEGWSMKKLHKLILTSETWQQATSHPDKSILEQKDPNNELLAYFKPRRLTAEELRDSLLVFTGELNPELGGLPARPEINREVALSPRMIQFSLAPAYQPNRTPAERNRRSLYAYRIRGLVDPMMEVFNKPGADKSCEERDAPSVTPQVFTLLNSELITNRSLAMAIALEKHASDRDEQIRRAFHTVFTRQPSEEELKTLSGHYDKMLAYHREVKPEPVTYPKEIVRSLVEEFSGEPFQYIELLDIYHDYQPDPQAKDQTPETRALADITLILFNTNELIYVY